MKLKLGLYSLLVAGSALLGVAKLAIFAKTLNSDGYGTYSLVLTTYVIILYLGSFGANEAMLKLGAMAFGQNNNPYLRNIRDIALFYGSLSIAIFGSLAFILLGYFLSEYAVKVLLLSAILSVFAFQFQIVDSHFRAKQEILKFSLFQFARSFLVILLGLSLAGIYGEIGVIYAEIFSYLVMFILSFFVGKENFQMPRLSQSINDITMLTKHGFSMISTSLLRFSAIALDRWAVTAYLGISVLGSYSFAMMTYQVGIMSIGFMTNILGPRWLARYAQTRDHQILLDSINKVCGLIVVLGILAAIPFLLVLPHVMEAYFPSYFNDNFILMVIYIYIGVVCLCCTYLYDWFFISISKESVLTMISGMMLALTAIGAFYLIVNKSSIIGFAMMFCFLRIASILGYFYAIKVCTYCRE